MLRNIKVIGLFQGKAIRSLTCHTSDKNRRKKTILLVCVGLLTGLLFFPSTGDAKTFQKAPVTLKASEILPKGLLSGPNYKLKEAVKNDGFINTYVLETKYGPLTVESTARLLIRINELGALQKMEKLKETDVYSKALLAAGSSPLRTAKSLITDPVKTTSAIFTGAGRWFSDVGRSITSDDPHQADVMKTALGHAAVKRCFAFDLGVDPYSSYEALQKSLNDIAWTSVAGGLTVKAAFMAIPGGAGVAVSTTGTAGGAKELVRDKSPDALESINQKKLEKMGVSDDLAHVFLMNSHFNPLEKTLLVDALAGMRNTGDRRLFIKAAATANEETLALYMRLRAQLMAKYSKENRVDSFVETGKIPVLRTKTGMIIGVFPLDHVLWTDELSKAEKAISRDIEKMTAVKGKELWITGKVTTEARKALEGRGWKVHDRIGEKLVRK